jgi:hypothetical protein
MKRLLFFAAVMAVMLSSCGGGANPKMETTDIEPAPLSKQTAQLSNGMANAKAVAESADTTSSSPIVPQSGAPNIPDWDKKIIKTAHVTLELKDYNAYNNSIHSKVKSYGAYIAQEQQNETDDEITNEISIKVPVDKFEDMMNSLAGEGIKVIEKNITTEDVTGEVVDTKARMEAKKQVRDRYLELLKQAKTMKDILDVQQEINGIQEDIESAAGRVNYLVHSSAYSTINLKYYQYLNGITAKEAEPTFLSKMGNAFKAGGSVILNIVIGAVSIWPLILAAAFLIFYFKKRKVTKGVEKAAE